MKESKKLYIESVNISKEKGTAKFPVNEIEINGFGIANDAHSGDWNRQVSILSSESISKFSRELKRTILPGEFAENLTVSGNDITDCLPLDRFIHKQAELEVTQIGKSCHGDSCAIFREAGKCVMPKEGIFCRVISMGKISRGDEIIYVPKEFKVLIITLSDRASQGIYEDKSGKIIVKEISDFYTDKKYNVKTDYQLIPDNSDLLKQTLLNAKNNYDAIFTTGGTGISEKDITPEVVKSMLDKEIPGIMEHIRIKSAQQNPSALLSRSIAGLIGKTLIFTLPGSGKAVQEYLTEIKKNLLHLSYMIHRLDLH